MDIKKTKRKITELQARTRILLEEQEEREKEARRLKRAR